MSRARREHPAFIRAWASREPGQLLGKGHPAGDFLQAHEWKVLEERQGFLKIRAHLPHHVRNPRGQLFGGFTPTYVDLLALFTVRAGESRVEERFRTWLATTNMRVDFFEPIGKRGQTTFRMTGDQGIRGVRSEKLSDPFSGPVH